jgi:hypothetical protein
VENVGELAPMTAVVPLSDVGGIELVITGITMEEHAAIYSCAKQTCIGRHRAYGKSRGKYTDRLGASELDDSVTG